MRDIRYVLFIYINLNPIDTIGI